MLLKRTITDAMNTASTSGVDDDNGITVVQRLACGTTGALLTAIFVTPLDVVKVRMQSTAAAPQRTCIVCSTGLMDHVHTSGLPTRQPAPWFVRPVPKNGCNNTGSLYALRRIVRKEGVTQLWSGLSPTLIMAIPTTVLYFSMYDKLLATLRHDGRVGWLAPALAGSIARTAAVTLVSPIEMLRTKMMSERMTYNHLFRLVAHSVRTSGPSSLWLGWTATILRDAPFSAIYWTTYDALKHDAMRRSHHDEPTFAIAATCGASAGTLATLCTQPFDVVKTRTQIAIGQALSKHADDLPSARQCTHGSMWECAVDIYRRSGMAGLYSGTLPRVVKVAPACAIMIGTYEFGKVFFRRHNQQTRDNRD